VYRMKRAAEDRLFSSDASRCSLLGIALPAELRGNISARDWLISEPRDPHYLISYITVRPLRGPDSSCFEVFGFNQKARLHSVGAREPFGPAPDQSSIRLRPPHIPIRIPRPPIKIAVVCC
jgi:hypothetical protein